MRTIDFAKIAKASKDGKVDVAVLTDGGDWGVKILPIGNGKEAVTHDVKSMEAAEGFVAGCLAMIELRKTGARGAVDLGDWDPSIVKKGADLLSLTRNQLRALNAHYELPFKQNDSKPDLAVAVKGKLPK